DLVIWRAAPNGRRLRKLITPDTKIPGGWGKFTQWYGNTVQISGDSLVLIGDNCGGCAVGLFTRSVFGGPITKLVDKNDTNPNFAGDDKHFGSFSVDFRAGQDPVVFVNRQNAFGVPVAGGPV